MMSTFSNFENPSSLGDIRAILTAALDAVNPEQAVHKMVRMYQDRYLEVKNHRFDLQDFEHIYIIGAGKGAEPMTRGLMKILSQRVSGGIVITKHVNSEQQFHPVIQFLQGNHPVPGNSSVQSTHRLVDFTKRFTEKDLVFCLITGGGSALMSLPHDPISLVDLQAVTALLLACGAEITEINTIRKHLDQVKGGGLAKIVYPATMISLILSDVIGNSLDVIASGPTVADQTTFQNAVEILRGHNIWEKTPVTIRNLLERGVNGEVDDTVKEGDECLMNVKNIIVGDNLLACLAAVQKSQDLGYNSLLLTTSMRGEARHAGIFLSSILREVAMTSHPVPRPACIIAGGETTVFIRGKGQGGRNQELALSAVKELAGIENIALITLATDGEDGTTNAAGAIVSGTTWDNGKEMGMEVTEYLADNDSYHYFNRLGDTLIIGPTGTNVNDITFLFAF